MIKLELSTLLKHRNILYIEKIENDTGHDKIEIKADSNTYNGNSIITIVPIISKGKDKDVKVKLIIEVKTINNY